MAKTTQKPQPWNLEAERVLWRAICAPNAWYDDEGNVATHPDSLWHFVCRAWGAMFFLKSHLSEPRWLYEPIHHPYLRWYQFHILEWKKRALSGMPGRTHLASILPRGYGKTVCEKAAILWSHLDDRDMTSLVQSATDDLSVDILKAQVAVMDGGKDGDPDSWFVWLYGDWISGAQEKARNYLKHGYRRTRNVSEPSIDASSAGVGATGYHPRQIFWDDPLEKNKLKKDRDAYPRAQHEAVNASFNSLQSNGLMVLTLTRYFDDDIAGRHFREEGVATWSGMPCPHMSLFDKVPFGEGIWHVYFYQTEDENTGEPTHPFLWTKEMIAARKRIDAEDFACQQQNNPGASEHAPLVESQVPWLYRTYQDFLFDVTPEWATIHIDTAFKDKETMGHGDDSVIVVWIKDSRSNGVLYLDTDLLRASNEWREEDFNKQLVKVCLNLRRRGIFIRAITDETEPGGKAGTYKNRILGILRTAGIHIGDEQFIRLNRKQNKKARIRTAVGHWSEGYVRILLNKDKCDCKPPTLDPKTSKLIPTQCPHFIVPPVVKKMINQIVKVDTTRFDDLADAQADGFIEQLWLPPLNVQGTDVEEGAVVRRPWDDDLKDVGKPISNEELLTIMADRDEMLGNGMLDDGGRGFDDEYVLPREPV